MVPLKVLTLVFTGPLRPSVLVLEPIEPEPQDNVSRIIPIWIGANEAVQLGAAIEHIKLPRPMTHDLFLDALTNLGARVDHVLIDRAEQDTFYSKLYIRQDGRLICLDARPTDSLSLAIREDAPFLIDEDVLAHKSFPYIFNNKANREAELRNFHNFIQNLTPDDFNLS
jgi:bifunctional DNase/RNase